MRKLVAELAANEQEIARLFAENNDHSEALEVQTSDANEISETKRRINAVLDRNKERILELQRTKETLEISKRSTEEKIQRLEQAIEANDYYTQILKMVRNRDVSDNDLALFIWSVKTVQGMDLDQLSYGRELRLIEVLINVSQPYGRRPDGLSASKYPNRHRVLGNLFVPRGLAWEGVPFDINTCRYVGSEFEKSSTDIAHYAQQKLGKPN